MDFYNTIRWAEKEHKRWMDSVADFEGDPELQDDEIKGDDDDTPDFDNQE